ncbi:MAG: rod shape-determining protein MreC [Proteobacteria bacterium]|nr:rod shape-determining protein MreC [Pseudomonadota bacterium]
MATIKKARTTSLLLADRLWLQRGSVMMLLAAGVALMAMSKAGNPAVARMRMQITDAVMPVLAVAASPMDTIHNAGQWLGELAQLRAENIALKNENIELLKWQEQAKSQAAELESLRQLMKAVPASKASYITARVVSDMGGPYVHSALISGGKSDGIRKDQAVISEQGLLGRVVDSGETSARVLLLSDINSRVPVMAEASREKSILVGNNTDTPSLAYLMADSKIKVGERIVTSGDGGIFPPGIPVGVVTSVQKGAVTVEPFLVPSRAQFVSVVDYDF